MMQTILELLDDRIIAESMIKIMEEHSGDFREDKNRCIEAVDKLWHEMGEGAVPSVFEEIEAIHRQFASNLIFSGFLGFQANLNHYRDPVARTFLDVDFETYLLEGTAKRLPEYENAQNMRRKFYATLSPEQREIYSDIALYADHLQSVGPKLAHYYGYLLGNAILPRVVPGYCPDIRHTTQYRRRLEDYLGFTVSIA